MGKKYTILFIIVTLRENIMEKIKPVIICMTPVTLKSKGYWLTDWKSFYYSERGTTLFYTQYPVKGDKLSLLSSS